MSWWQPNDAWQNQWYGNHWQSDGQWSRDYWQHTAQEGRWVWQEDRQQDQQEQSQHADGDGNPEQNRWQQQVEQQEGSYGWTGGESQHSTWSGYGYGEGEWGHSSGIPRGSSGRDDATSEGAGRGGAGDDQGKEVSNGGSGSNEKKKPVTGKEVVPSYNGESALREYKRRVDLFLATTGIDEEFRAGRLMEKLEGRAWQATQTLQVSKLRSSEGVQYLLQHLQKELEPVEHLQTFQTLHEFFRGFKRNRGEEFSTYDTRFRAQLQKMEEIGAPLDGLVRSYWFLEGSGISPELRKQVISAAGGSYEYERLRAALVAIVPTVKREDTDPGAKPQHSSPEKPRYERRSGRPHGVHAVEESVDGDEAGDGEEEKGSGEIDDEEALAMEQEAQVLLTQAAKRRSMAEKGRGFQRVESTEERENRIKHMKTKMACSACRAHGKTNFGHWHADKACPYYEESMAYKKQKEQEKSSKVFVVQEAASENDEESDSDQPAYEVMITWSEEGQKTGLAMTDTCCARTVVGEEWAEKHMEFMWKQGVEFLVVREQQPFRFGPGRRIYSTFALIFPLAIENEKKIAILRASVVPQKVPLLLSKRVLAELGATMYLRKECIEFEELETTTQLLTTDNDQVAIKIDSYDLKHREVSPEVLMDVVKDEEEVSVLSRSRTGLGMKFSRHDGSLETPQEPVRKTKDKHVHMTKTSSNQQPGSISEVTHQQPRGEASNGGSKGEGGLCGGDQQGDQGQPRGPEEARSPSSEGDLDVGSSKQACSHSPCGLEAGKSGHVEGDLPRPGCRRLGSPKGRQALGGMETIPVLARNRPVEPRCGRDTPGLSSRVNPSDSSLPSVRDRHGTQDKPAHSGGLLGLSSFSPMQGDIVLDIQRTAGGGDAAADEEGERRSKCQEASMEWNERKGGLWRRGQEIFGSVRSRLGKLMGDGRCGDGRKHRPHEHEPDGRGDEADHGNAWSEGRGDKDSTLEGGLRVEDSRRRGSERDTGPSEKPKLSQDEIRKRIIVGNNRRKNMKKGVARRLLGNIKQWIGAVCLVSAVHGMSAVGCLGSWMGSQQPDILEVFAGKAEVSYQFARYGWNSLEPCDIEYGFDLRDKNSQQQLLTAIAEQQPRLVVVAYPCTVWSPLAELNYRSPQDRRRLQKLRERDKPFLELTEAIFQEQIKNGRDALGENPLRSKSFKEKSIQNVLNHPEVVSGIGHGCRYDIRNIRSGQLVKKPTLWFSTSKEIVDELTLKCRGDHEHGVCMGGKDVTQHAGRYTKQIAKSIHRGFVNMLKRKDPGRIRRLLRDVSVRLRSNKRNEEKTELRWCQKHVEKQLKQWQHVYAVTHPMESSSSKGEQVETPEEPEERVEGMKPLNPDGIRFDVPAGRRLAEPARQALRKMHCNLGHPSSQDMQRFLRLGGVKKELIEAVGWMKCMSCQHGKRPKPSRTVSMPPHDLQFGDEVCLDCFHIHDADQKGHWFLSILDRATSFHVVSLLKNHSPEHLCEVFNQAWCHWAGYPSRMSVDMEGGFRGEEFWSKVGDGCVPVIPIASTAHWQAGKIERHGQTMKRMMETAIRHGHARGEKHMQEVAQEAARCKNELAREHGWSPNMLVFGRDPRGYGEVLHNGNSCAYHPDAGTKGSDLARHIKFRYHARLAYVKHQAKHMLMRTIDQRMRKGEIPQQGQMVFFWREARIRRKQMPSSNWMGPGFVVGHQGSSAWVACGGRCYLVAGEHLRLAVGDEEQFGAPEVQRALALFKKRDGENATYEDLTKQKGPEKKDWSMEDVEMEILQDSDDEMRGPKVSDEWFSVDRLAGELLRLSKLDAGWHVDQEGNHVHVGFKAFSFVNPSKHDSRLGRFRTTWAWLDRKGLGGKWTRLEDGVDWTEMGNPGAFLPEVPVKQAITIFGSRKRKDELNPGDEKSSKMARTQKDRGVFVVSTQKQKRMMDKEVPYDKIPPHEKELYREAEVKEWGAWKEYGTVVELEPHESEEVRKNKGHLIVKSRMVYRNKNAGLIDGDGQALQTRAKARLCALGQFAPGVVEALTPVDSPTVQRISTFFFLHYVVSMGWMKNWRIGDVSNAFLQGEIPEGKELYLEQPIRGLPGVKGNNLFRLKKTVYGLPEAPRAWYDSLCGILVDELGFTKSVLDPAMFFLKNGKGEVSGILIIHVDDIMVASDGQKESEDVVEKLHNRLPFGEWSRVHEQEHGVKYCGKELRIEQRDGEDAIVVSQRGFVEGRLEEIPIDGSRKKEFSEKATEMEITDFRSTVGSLQWLATQSRPDIAFETNQLQKRVPDLRVEDLSRANKLVREVKKHHHEIVLRNLGKKWKLVVFHDAALFNSVGVEIDEKEADDLLFKSSDKKLVYSQKGCLIGFVNDDDMHKEGEKCNFNLLDWKSSTNKRVIESSFAAETQAALMGHGQAHFCQNLIIEMNYGRDVLVEADSAMQQKLQPIVMVTDCKSLYDTVRKQGQNTNDKGSIVSIVLIRQICDTQGSGTRAHLLWVPTEHQLADSLTKGGKGEMLRQCQWKVKLHEKALRRGQPRAKTPNSQKDIDSNVNSGL